MLCRGTWQPYCRASTPQVCNRPADRREHRRSTCCNSSSGGDGGGQQQPQQPPAEASQSPSSSSSDAGSPASSGGSGSTYSRNPWELMGRMVSEQRVALQYDTQINYGLVRSAAARESGLEYEEFEARLTRLLTLMPFLQQRMLRLAPKLLAALAADPELIVARLIQLKSLLPAADVAAIVGQRPSLLLDPEWQRVAGTDSSGNSGNDSGSSSGSSGGAAALVDYFGEADAARLAAAEPQLLVEDLAALLQELQRLMPQQDPAAALLRQPSLAASVFRLSNLSLWYSRSGTEEDARRMLLQDPRLLYSVQRGTSALGPGAEFM